MKSRLAALVAPFTLLTTLLQAQGPVFPVGDLLGSPPAWTRDVAASVVRPSPSDPDCEIIRLPDGDKGGLLRHVVSGEGQLLRNAGPGGTGARSPVLGERTLLEVLDTLVPSAQGAFRVTRAGDSFFVRARRATEQLEAGLGTIRAALPPDLAIALRLERVVGGQTTALLSAVESIGFGDVAVVGDLEHTTAVADLEVEIAQSSMTSNPVVFALTHGSSVLVRARPLPGRLAAVLEVVARTVVPFAGKEMPNASVSGAVDRICNRIDQAGLAFRVERGAESAHEWTACDGSRLRLRCRVDWPGQEPTPIAPLLCSPLLRQPILGFRGIRRVEPTEPTERYSVADFVNEEFEWASDRGEVPVRRFGEEGAAAPVLYFAGQEGRQLAERIAGRIDELLAPRRITVEVFDVAAGAQPEDPALLWQFAGPVLVGLPSCFSTGREQTYLRDWDVEVAQSARMPDPKVSLVEEGWFATAKVQPPDARGRRGVDLTLETVRLLELRQRSIMLSPQLVGSTADAKVELPQELVTVEQPVTRTFGFATVLELDGRGVAEQRRVAPGLLVDGRELLVRVRVE
ncbi:MAG: hypothetical protein FJ265_07650 [Planctomycetes bacterium]|nr:hypothetical protein [Planctomycetota bacterium]